MLSNNKSSPFLFTLGCLPPVMVSRLNRWMFCIRKIAAKASGQECAILHLTYKYYYEHTALGLIIQSGFFCIFFIIMTMSA